MATTKTGLKSADVKAKALKLGADIAGICSAEAVNANPPDANIPQTPLRLWQECRSLIVLGKHIPWGMFRSQDMVLRRFVPISVMNTLDTMALNMAYYLESKGYAAFGAPSQLTDTRLKNGTYGPLSLRHLAVEAGLGTLGLTLSLLTPQYGPRLYLTAVLTNAELESDKRLDIGLCLGVSCGRCLLACPSDAVEHWGLNKRKCSSNAQVHGVGRVFSHLDAVVNARTTEDRLNVIHGMDTVSLWQALRTGVGAYGGCSRCIEVCPVGEDYKQIKDIHSIITEATDEKGNKLQAWLEAEKKGEISPGWQSSRRWLGVSTMGRL